jgi:hypothetical protein
MFAGALTGLSLQCPDRRIDDYASLCGSVLSVCELLPGLCPFASGLRGVQSAGGKAMCQNRGAGSTNSMPTFVTPLSVAPRSTTRQATSSWVVVFFNLSKSSSCTALRDAMDAPCIFTRSVLHSSDANLPVTPPQVITTSTLTHTR